MKDNIDVVPFNMRLAMCRGVLGQELKGRSAMTFLECPISIVLTSQVRR